MRPADFFDWLQEPCPVAPGTRLELVYTNDAYTRLRPGARGTVTGGNGGQVWMRWEDGSTLALIPGVDRWNVLRCEHAALEHGATCPECFWQRPSEADEANEGLKRQTEAAIAAHPNTYRGRA